MKDHPAFPTVFDTLVGYQRSAALATALELDLFSVVHGGKRTASAVAAACGVAERGARSLCDYLVCDGFLEKDGDDYHVPAAMAELLVRGSPQYIGSIAEFVRGETLRTAFDRLTDSVRLGHTVLGERGTMDPEHPTWIDFARGMAPIIDPQAALLARLMSEQGVHPRQVLDIAAGHGLYGIHAARMWPDASVTLADWPTVLQVAEENVERAGLGPRVQY